MSGPQPIHVYLGFTGNNPAGPWCVCSLGVVDGRGYPYSRMVMGPRSNFGAAWAAVALSLERLAGRPAVLWTTLAGLASEAADLTWRDSQATRAEEHAAFLTCKRTGVEARAVRQRGAAQWLAQAQETARRGFAEWRREEQGKVIP